MKVCPAPAGLFFCHHLRSHAHMDPDLENVIRQALGAALAAGKDHMGQTVLAVQAVQLARPDMTASDAMALVPKAWGRAQRRHCGRSSTTMNTASMACSRVGITDR